MVSDCKANGEGVSIVKLMEKWLAIVIRPCKISPSNWLIGLKRKGVEG